MGSKATYLSEDLKNKQCAKSNYSNYLHQKQTFRKHILKEDISSITVKIMTYLAMFLYKTCSRNSWRKKSRFEDVKQNF